MKSNLELQKEVQDELKWETSVNDTDITVNVENGVVTLTGAVDSLLKKRSAVETVKHITQVKSVKCKIMISTRKLSNTKKQSQKGQENNFATNDENIIKVSGA